MNSVLPESEPSRLVCSNKISNWIKFLYYSHNLVIKFEVAARKKLEGLKKKKREKMKSSGEETQEQEAKYMKTFRGLDH